MVPVCPIAGHGCNVVFMGPAGADLPAPMGTAGSLTMNDMLTWRDPVRMGNRLLHLAKRANDLSSIQLQARVY